MNALLEKNQDGSLKKVLAAGDQPVIIVAQSPSNVNTKFPHYTPVKSRIDILYYRHKFIYDRKHIVVIHSVHSL